MWHHLSLDWLKGMSEMIAVDKFGNLVNGVVLVAMEEK